MAQWIDFKALRSKMNFEAVLKFYGVEMHQKGEQHVGLCPLPTHRKDGRQNTCFSVNLEKNLWQCFGCKKSGNALDFVAHMEGLNPADSQGIRKAAQIVQDRFLRDVAEERRGRGRGRGASHSDAPSNAKPAAKLPQVVNPPLDFTLKNLDPDHPYFKENGLSRDTVDHFGLGYCSKGHFDGRVVAPLQNEEGALIGYVGVEVDNRKISDKYPKYLFPINRQRDGKEIVFDRSLLLYNAFRIQEPVKDLIVVQELLWVWWLSQNGYLNTVAVVGDASQHQVRLIVKALAPTGRVWLATDDSREQAERAERLLAEVSKSHFCRWAIFESLLPDADRSPLAFAGAAHAI